MLYPLSYGGAGWDEVVASAVEPRKIFTARTVAEHAGLLPRGPL